MAQRRQCVKLWRFPDKLGRDRCEQYAGVFVRAQV